MPKMLNTSNVLADMLKYLIIQLTDDAASFCHYERKSDNGLLISSETLRDAIFWAMKENLSIQFIYPDSELSNEYKQIIHSIDHTSIVCAGCRDAQTVANADVVVFSGWDKMEEAEIKSGISYILRTSKGELFANSERLHEFLMHADRLVVVITDIDKFTNEDCDNYARMLDSLVPVIREEYRKDHPVQLNLLTDRMFLDGMNNCNAGWESITLAPDGKFYICPAFYLDGGESVGDLQNGLDVRNPQLYRLDHAPICRNCDAWHCRRCVWLNRKTTLEVNTPSHEQCVVAHLERNASRKLLKSIRELGEFLPGKEIKAIDYLDPFEIINK